MIYLPDTNVWIGYLNPGQSPVKQKIITLSPADICFCSVVKAELFFGAYKSLKKEENLALLNMLSSRFISLPFDDNAAKSYGRIRADLAASGRPIGPNDLLIAAIALANKVTLVTHNTDEFGRVAGLKIEDWEC